MYGDLVFSIAMHFTYYFSQYLLACHKTVDFITAGVNQVEENSLTVTRTSRQAKYGYL